MATVQELLVKITGDASSFKKAIDETKNAGTMIGSAFEGVGKKISSIGKTATATLTVPIVGAATAAVKNFAEVDKTMSLTNATMNNTAEEAEMLEQAMASAAQNSIFGMQDAATASLNFARAGLNATEAANTLAPAMNLAAGEGGNLDTVSAGLVATINGFHGSFDEAGHYADVFANACNNSALDINTLSDSMSIAAPVFSAAGYNINDAALYMGVMANAGIDANKAANSLKTGLARLVSPPKEAAEALDDLHISVTNADGSMKDSITIQKELHDAFAGLSESEQLAAASAIFGKNQMAPWLALINTAPGEVDELSAALEKEGTTSEMAEAMMSGFGGSLEKLKSSIDVASHAFGESLAPMVSSVAEKIQNLTTWYTSLDKSQQQTIAKIALLVAAGGPLLMMFGKLATGIGSVITITSKISGAFSGATSALGGMSKAAGSAGGAVGSAAASFGTFAGQALKLAAVAAVILAAAAAIKILVDAAIQLHSAGPGAIATFAGLAAAAVGITAAIAAIGSACTATAPGLLALGATVLMVTGGIAAVTAAAALLVEAFADLVDSITKFCDKIPLIEKHGVGAAKGLATLAAGLAALGVAAGAAAIPIGTVDLALAAFDLTAGTAIPIIGGLTLAMTAAAASITLLNGSLTGLAAALTLCNTAFIQTFTTISTIVGSTVSAVIGFVGGLVEKVIGFFKDLKYKLIGDPIVTDMCDGINKLFSELVNAVVEFVKGLVDKVVQFFVDLKDKVVTTVTDVKNKVQEHFNNMKEKVVQTTENLKDKVKEGFKTMKEKVVELTKNTKDKVQEHYTNMKEKVNEITTDLSNKVKEKFTEIKTNITEKTTEAKDKAKQKFTELKTSVSDKMRETVNDVKQKCNDIVNKFKGINLLDVGKNVVSGFLNGLKSAWDGVTSWVRNACSSIKSAFEDAMRIGSPSKVFAQYGKFIDQGLVIGLQTGETDITRQVYRLANGVMNGFTGSLNNTNGVSYGNANNSGNTVINMNGDYMFQDKESMDYFLNRLGLVLARG